MIRVNEYKEKNQFLFYYFIISIMILTIIFVYMFSQHKKEINILHQKQLERDIQLIGSSIQESLLKNDYTRAKTTLEKYTKLNKSLLHLELKFNNGFELFRYHNKMHDYYDIKATNITFKLSENVSFYIKAVTYPKSLIEYLNSQEKKSFNFIALILVGGIITYFFVIRKFAIEPREKEIKSTHTKLEYVNVILDNIEDNIFVFEDKNYKFVYCNKSTIEDLEYTKEELYQMTPRDLNNEISKDTFLEIIKKCQDTSINFRSKHKSKSGRIIDVQIILQKSIIEEKTLYIAVVRDITKLIEREKEDQVQQSMMIQNHKMAAMGEMIGSIAHQWRQPLNAVGVMVQEIFMDLKINEIEDIIQPSIQKDIKEQLKYMSNTIDDFREFFKEDKLTKEINLKTNLKHILIFVSSQYKNHAIDLKLIVDGEPCKDLISENKNDEQYIINTYPNELKQVILNILFNSKDAILEKDKEFKGIVTINLNKTQTDFIITIEDNAGGVEEEKLERIWEPFFTTKMEGTGIGLYMSKTIVEKHLEGKIKGENTKQGFLTSIKIPKKLKSSGDNNEL